MHSDTHDVFVFQTDGLQAVGGPHARRRRGGPARARPVDVPAHRHPPRRPRPGDRLPARHPRHQPAHLARPRRAHASRAVARRRARRAPAGRLPRPPERLADELGRPARGRSPTTYAASTPTAAVERRGPPLPDHAAAPGCRAASRRARRRATSTTHAAAPPPGPPVRRSLDRGDRLEVLLGDRSLDVPGLAAAGARGDPRPRRAAAGRPRRLLDPQSRLVLCRRLVREGLLEVVG